MLKTSSPQSSTDIHVRQAGQLEVGVSRETARHLGMPWHFVPYSRRQWRQWYQSADMAAYRPFCSRHVATPHIQDWPAVLELKHKGMIDADAVFIPGHTCMLTSANRLDRSIARLPDLERRAAMAASLFRHHFTAAAPAQSVTRSGGDQAEAGQAASGDLGRDVHSLLNAYFNFEGDRAPRQADHQFGARV